MDNKKVAERAVAFVCDLLAVPEPSIIIGMRAGDEQKVATIYFTEDNKADLYLNEAKAFNSERELIFAVLHECRHYYQFLAVRGEFNENRVLVEKWQKEFSNYKSSKEDGYDIQFTELDASFFAAVVLKALGITFVEKEVEDHEYFKYLQSDFEQREIVDIYREHYPGKFMS